MTDSTDAKKRSNTGRKVLYALVIAMSSLIALLSVAGIIGVWGLGNRLSNAAVTALQFVENSAQVVQASALRVDNALANLQAKTTEIMDASRQVRENVSDQGLVLTLLPEEKEQQLVQDVSEVRDTFAQLKESISTGLNLYRSIDQMPLINLPSLDEDQMSNIEMEVEQTRTQAESLRAEIADFRSGVSGEIGKVESAASKLNERIQSARDKVAKVNTRMADLEALSVSIQQNIPGILFAISLIISLLLVFVIWTQVEMIRFYVARWRLLE